MSEALNIFKLSQRTTQDLANGKWSDFLRTAAWNYKYSFPNQVLIYAQRPDATACASMEVWNKKLRRSVNADAAGIALIEDAGETLSLSYIYDVSDTHSPTGSQIPLWAMISQQEEEVRLALADTFLPGSHPYRDAVMDHDPTTFYYEVAFGIADQLSEQSVQDLLSVKESCPHLANLDDKELEYEFRTLLHSSITAVLMYRCGLEPDIDPFIWDSAKRFNNLQSMAILGQTTQSLARQGLDVARVAVRKWNLEHKEEIIHEQQSQLSAGRTVSGTGITDSRAEASEQVREDAQAVSAGTKAQSVYTDDALRGPDDTSVRHWGTDSAAGERTIADASGTGSGTGQGEGQPELDETYDTSADKSRGDGLSGDDLRITGDGEPLPDASEFGIHADFPTLAEQDAVIQSALSQWHLTQDEVQFVLDRVMEEKGVNDTLIDIFANDPNSAEASEALREAYENLIGAFPINFNNHMVALCGRSYGIEVFQNGNGTLISWQTFADYFKTLVRENRFEKAGDAMPEQPQSSSQLQEGQVIHLSGTPYQVTSISADAVAIQDVNHPIFTQTIQRNILDLLLRPKNNQVTEKSAPEKTTPVHPPEPLIDHPELIARNLSGDARQDKVVLTDLLMHFVNYRSTYAGFMPALSASDALSYTEQRESLADMSAAGTAEENRDKILEAVAFFNRWFVPFSEDTWESIRTDLELVLNAAQNLLDNWEHLDLSEEAVSEPVQEAPEETEEVQNYTLDSFQVGAFYEDAYGRGVITAVSAEDYEGRHKATFAFADPDAPEGSRDAKGYAITSEIALARLLNGTAKLIPAEQWQAQREAHGTAEPVKSSEPSLFDFTFDSPQTPITEKVHSAPVSVNAAPDKDPSERTNFHIDQTAINYGGPKARFQNNIAAIQLLKELEGENRLANEEEQKVLSRYVGWGGIPEAFDASNLAWQSEYSTLKELLTEEEYASARESTLTAFYTPPAVTEAIFNTLRQLGFRNGNVLDPCCGTGNFFGQLPEDMADSRLYGVELDAISGRIGRQLYQDANIVIEGYEKTSLPDSMFDVAIGNVPFGNFKLNDRRYDKENFLIHDYFFAKTLDKVRPGGIIAFVTSTGTMDKKNDAVRRYIAQRADLLGAIRLPDNTFKANAGTDVASDIIFLRKRERPRVEEPYWIGLDRKHLGGNDKEDFWGPAINAYFVDNPQMVLGDIVETSGPYGPVVTCKAREGEDLRTELQKAIKWVEGSIGDRVIDVDALEEAEERFSIPADPDVRNFSFTVVDGDVYFREDSRMFRCDLNKTAEQRVKGLVKLRNITRDLISAQMENAPEAHINSLQESLNKAYDAFTKKYGIINSTANERAFSDDSSYFLLCSLENLDEEGNFISKADMFYKRTIGQHQVPEHVETAREALAVSLGELGKIDLKYMSDLSDLSEEKLVSDLEGLIFPVPGDVNRYEIASLYLSGNVREKLEEARQAAQKDPRFQINVEHLKKVQPEPLEPADISVRLGSTWIPSEDYKDFILETLKLPEHCERYMKVEFEPTTGYWNISGKNLAPWSTLIHSTYGTSKADAISLIEKSLNLQDVQIFKTVKDANGEEKRILDSVETMAAQEKQQILKDKFKEWIWAHPDRRDRICRIYNQKFNSIVPPSFPEDLVQFHGLNPHIELASHQKESVARILYNGNTLLAHCVGAGKTWTMTAAAMEGKYLGLCNKSMVVVPNHLIGQWAAAIYEAYPQANVLAATEKDFTPANRKKFCSRIATGDYDIVVIGHSHFEKIPLSAERQEATIRKEMDDILDSISALKASEGESFSVKKLEQAKKSMQTKLDKLHNSKKRDDVVTFEELGVDRLFLDESHNYKNLFLSTKMHNVAGISQTDSQRASDMFVKCRYMDEITGGMGVIHGTGSPLSNTMAELYTTQRYLQYDELQKMGLGAFDAWASTFGETVVALELAPEGNGYRPRTRFAKFFNVPELMNMYKQVADIRTKDMLNLPVPAVEYQTVVLKPSEDQKRIVKSFGERADKIRKGGVNNRDDNMLVITNEGRKVALDQRLIDPTLPDDPNSKTAACAERIWEFYNRDNDKKLTQLVFCDLSTPKNDGFDVYHDLKDKLIAKGIPADEIRFIHEANTVPQKEALFSKVRSGSVRILMGSTGKMGTGTNVQNLLIAGHDLDAPWRPSDLEQRTGRVIRRGNENDMVYMVRYVTEGSFDAYMYQLLEIKQKFSDQIMTSKNPARVVDDVDGAALNYAEIKALSSGDDRIREKVTLEMEISRLEVLKNRYASEQFHMEHQAQVLPVEIQGLKERIPAMEEDLKKVASMPSRTSDGKLIPAVVKGETFKLQEETGNAIVEAVKKLPNRDTWVTVGTLRGFEIQGMSVDNGRGEIGVKLALSGKCRYPIELHLNGATIMSRFNNMLDYGMRSRLDFNKKRLAACESDLITIRNELNKPFPDEATLQEKKARLAELDEALNLEALKETESIEEGEVEVVASSPSGKMSLSDMIANASARAGTGAGVETTQERGSFHSRS